MNSYVDSSASALVEWPAEGLEKLVAFLAISDSWITASSVYGSNHAPKICTTGQVLGVALWNGCVDKRDASVGAAWHGRSGNSVGCHHEATL